MKVQMEPARASLTGRMNPGDVIQICKLPAGAEVRMLKEPTLLDPRFLIEYETSELIGSVEIDVMNSSVRQTEVTVDGATLTLGVLGE